MTDIKELALQEAKDMLLQHYYDNGDYATFSVELCTRFLAAYLAEQEPVARVRVTNAAISWSAYYPTTLPIGEYDLFTTPPLPEPAPQLHPTHEANFAAQVVLCAAPSSEEVREMMKYLYSIDEHIAANMIERLAARVPDGLCIGGRHE